jgi:uncharacterized C2H2 Zn-finger protein
MSLSSVSVERKIALIEPMVTDLKTLEWCADAIDLPFPLAKQVAELHGYPDIGRMSGHLEHLREMVGNLTKPVKKAAPAPPPSALAQQPARHVKVVESAHGVHVVPNDSLPSHDGTPDTEHTYLEHLLARARRSHSSALHAVADRVEKLVKDLEDRVSKEEKAQAERDKAKALAAARVKRRAELKAELAALDDGESLPCPHPACDKVYKYAAALEKHIDKEHPQP